MRLTNILAVAGLLLLAVIAGELYRVHLDLRAMLNPVQCGNDYDPCAVRIERP